MTTYNIDPDTLFLPVYRHWHAQSEKYTGCDSLMTALEEGWKIDGVVFRQEFWLSGVRPVCVFHVDLKCGGEHVKMRVTHNPAIVKLLCDLNVQVVAINQRKQEERVRFF